MRLLKNKIYLVTSFGICCEISIVSGFVVFLPKYIETQFGTSKSEASLFTGKAKAGRLYVYSKSEKLL